MIDILYFASLRERVGTDREQLPLPADIATVAALTRMLAKRGGAWTEAMSDASLKVAVNQTMATPETPLKDGDEVAFFPPVTGG